MYNWNSQIFKINHFINVNEKIAKSFNALIYYEIINCSSCFFEFLCVSFFIFFILLFFLFYYFFSYLVVPMAIIVINGRTIWHVHNWRFSLSFNQFDINTSAERYSQAKNEKFLALLTNIRFVASTPYRWFLSLADLMLKTFIQ